MEDEGDRMASWGGGKKGGDGEGVRVGSSLQGANLIWNKLV